MIDWGNRPPRDVDWAQSVVRDIAREKRLSASRKYTMALRFADIGNYTPEARRVLRDYAATLDSR